MLRSSEVRLRLLSVRHGLVVTEVRCDGSVSVTIVGASCRGGEDNGVYVSVRVSHLRLSLVFLCEWA